MKIIANVGLGFGDEGKGLATDYLAKHYGADTVIRYSGGCQAAHNVKYRGNWHTFSQFGAATLRGARTHLHEAVIIDPLAMLNEAEHLKELGVSNPFGGLTIHPRCLVTTPMHAAVNRHREIARGEDRHGSCGMGIGEARSYHLQYGEDAIFAEDIAESALLSQKLLLYYDRNADILPEAWEYETSRLTLDLFRQTGHLLKLVEIPAFRIAIAEGSQGVLLDEWNGFNPWTTWSTVTLDHACDLADEVGAELETIGVMRYLMTRHGPGPFPTEDS